MKSYNQEFKNIIIIYFDQSITNNKYILLRFIIYYYYYYYYSTDLHIRIPISLDQRIETYYNISKKEQKQMLLKNSYKLDSPFENWFQIKKEANKLEELHRQMEEGELVDSIQGMDQGEFEIMFDIFRTEYKARYGTKAGNLISSSEKEGDY